MQRAQSRIMRQLRECFWWDRAFLMNVLMVTLPMVMQQLVGASLHIVDGLMVSAMGDAAYSAVTQANRITFMFNLFCLGTSTGGAIFLSQFWGAKDLRRMRQAMGLALAAVAVIAGVFAAAAQLFPRTLIGLFLLPGESFEMAVDYLRIVSLGYLFTAVDQVYAATIKAAEKTWIPMVSSLVSIGANTLLNYMLIFGHFGCPAMGVKGAALATAASAAIAMLMDIGFSYAMRLPSGAKPAEWLGSGRAFRVQFWKTVVPVIFNEGLWAIGTTMYSVYYGRMGDSAVAAMGVCNTINDLIWVAVFALAGATGILVGKTLGSGDRDKAYLCAKRLLAGTVAIGVGLGLVVLLVHKPMVGVFSGLSNEVRVMAERILLIGGFCIWFRAFNTTNIVGVLRSGGDTVFSLILDIGVLWVISVPLTGVAALVWRWPLEWVFVCTMAEELVKAVIGVPHFASRKWMHILTENA